MNQLESSTLRTVHVPPLEVVGVRYIDSRHRVLELEQGPFRHSIVLDVSDTWLGCRELGFSHVEVVKRT